MSYTVRVELHDATWSDYEVLHAQMAAQGFSRQIRSDEGAIYQLPPAEYVMTNSLAACAVLERAKTAAAATRKSAEVFVATTTAWTWSGLARA